VTGFSETMLILELKMSVKDVDVNVMPYSLVPIYPTTRGHTRHSNIWIATAIGKS